MRVGSTDAWSSGGREEGGHQRRSEAATGQGRDRKLAVAGEEARRTGPCPRALGASDVLAAPAGRPQWARTRARRGTPLCAVDVRAGPDLQHELLVQVAHNLRVVHNQHV
eukprot:5267028-Prymnesium_polylepis.1